MRRLPPGIGNGCRIRIMNELERTNGNAAGSCRYAGRCIVLFRCYRAGHPVRPGAREPFWLCPACVQTILEAHRSPSFCASDGNREPRYHRRHALNWSWSLALLGIRWPQRVYTAPRSLKEFSRSRRSPISRLVSTARRRRLSTNWRLRCEERWPSLKIALCFFSLPYYGHLHPMRIARQSSASGNRARGSCS